MIQSDPIWFPVVVSMMAAPFLAAPIIWVCDKLGISSESSRRGR